MDLKEAAKEHQRQSEIARRRTFAVISHPDAGKTTLTEKLLLFAGAIQSAGAVKARKSARHTASDWMAIEKERGISVASSVMQFEHRDYVINLLDTPGHQDFSEDTYRVLTAVDAALMLIDAAKGVEERTIKLLEVCRLRATPIITFLNKLDREVRDPLELMDEIERVLDIECAPVTWPIGAGKVFRGVYGLERGEVMLFAPGREKAGATVEVVRGLDDPRIAAMCGPGAPELQRAADEVGLVRAAGHRFDRKRFLDGRQTPVFFGSAINNFGVREVLDALVDLAPPPGARDAGARLVQPTEPSFTGFVFKVQANMDPLHRDRVAFMRVCSGRFRHGMMLRHLRTGKTMRCANVVSFLSQRREAVEDAWPGDVIGLYNRGGIQIGDTFSEGEELRFAGIPFFAPELFATVRLRDPIKSKQLRKGLQQLGEEGAIQVLRPLFASDTVLGAVGPLQFEVTVHRLRTEYGVDATFETAPYKLARWVSADSRENLAQFERENASRLARDAAGDLAILLAVPAILEVVQKQWPRIRFHATREHAGLDAS